MVDPTSGAQVLIPDSRSEGSRFFWSVLAAGEIYPVLEARSDDSAQARSAAEAALRAYEENRVPDEYFVV
jgi:hypothetical protein